MTGLQTMMDAWSIWWAGLAVDKDLVIWGTSLRWWDRIGQLLQLWGIVVLTLEVIGEERLRRFDRWAFHEIPRVVLGLNRRLALLMIDIALPLAKVRDSLQSFFTLLRIAVVIMIIIIVPSVIVGIISRSTEVGISFAPLVVNIVVIVFGIIWHLFALFVNVLIVISTTVPVALFSSAVFVIALARVLAYRCIGNVVKVISGGLFLVGTYFSVLAS